MVSSNALENTDYSIKARVVVLGIFIGSILLVSTLDLLCGLGLQNSGVHPRDPRSLSGILFAPWLHASFGHLFSNIGALSVLGWFCLWPRIARFIAVTGTALLGSGLAAWLFGGSHTVHIGASGIVFGYFGFLIMRGWYERTFAAIAVSLGVVLFYGSLVFGVLPLEAGISWQSHLGGFIAGIVSARCFRIPLRRTAAPNR